MKNIKLCVFDMAGTTVDEDNVVYKTVRDVIVAQGYNVSLEKVLLHGAGKEKYQAITDVLKNETKCKSIKEIADKAFLAFKPTLEKTYSSLKVKPIDGAEKTIKYLRNKGIYVVLNTGYNQKIAKQLLEKIDWKIGDDIDGLITDDDVKNGRPYPDMIKKAMELVNITNPLFVLKAGDSAIDIEEGKNANCGVTVGVLSGAQNKEQIAIAKPTIILDSIKDLSDKI